MSNDVPKSPGKPFQKGASGNPGGRPKGYERQLREVIDSMTAEDPAPAIDPEIGLDPATNRLRRIPAWQAIVKRAVLDAVAGDKYAREFVADRLMGKPKLRVEVIEPAEDVDLSALTDEQIEALAALPLVAAQDSDQDAPPTEH